MPLSEKQIEVQLNMKAMQELNERGIHPSLFISSSDYEAVFKLYRDLTAQAEKYQSEVERAISLIAMLEEDVRKRNIFIDRLAQDLASRDSELRELREVAEGMAEALRKLSYNAQTSGGVAGRDTELMKTIDIAEQALAAYRKIKPEIKP